MTCVIYNINLIIIVDKSRLLRYYRHKLLEKQTKQNAPNKNNTN